ncbi:MAG: ABC transporter substrate-binding protein [Lachnospiraceae bacterium]|nr:ABC transporter substrate-binding protein [Lachnospiraceae bacterium]MCI9132997.1 ABC transporter substrate-binding protein [Lachnospiraceae bacterium]
MKRWIAMFLVVTMLFSMTACGKKEASGDKPAQEAVETPEAGAETGSGEKQYLKVQLPLNDTLSGLKSTFTGGYGIVSQWIFGTLMRYDTEAGEYVPALAEKLDISDDGLVYTVTLKDNKFHDGTPITADDVVFTFTMAIRAGSGRVSKLSSIEGFEAASSGEADTVSGIQKIDDKTVAFTLSQPNSVFVEALSNGSFGILPSACFEGMEPSAINENAEFWKQPVGSGAYYVSEIAYPNYIVLTRFEDYYDPSGIENVLCTYYADLEAANAALASGELDWTLGLEEEAANNILSQNSNMEGITVETTYHRWFLANTSGTAGDGESHPSLKNPKVRHALDMLLDKDAICQLYGSLASPANSHMNTALPEYNSDLPAWKRDVEGAKKILEEENYRFDIPLQIYSNYTDQITADFLDLVVQNLAEGGVEATYTIDGNWQGYLESANYDLRYMATSSAIPTTFYELNSFGGLTSTTINSYPVNEEGFEEYQRSRYDDLILAYKAALDPTEQKEILDQLQYNSYEDMYDIVLYSLSSINLYSKRWSGMPVFSSDYSEIADFKFSNWKLLDE